MSNTKEKKLARAMSAKTGMPHQAAINALRAKSYEPPPPPDPEHGMFVGDGRPEGPHAFVFEGPDHAPLSPPGVQIIRSFHNEHGTKFSVQCDKCARWIFCGDVEREATCACGNPYRVLFDEPENWDLRQGMVCMDCGTPFTLTQPFEGKNPWRNANAWQIRCNACCLKAATMEKVDVLKHLHWTMVTATEQMLGHARQYKPEPRLAEAVARVRAALDDVTRHHEQVVARVGDGGDDNDPDAMAAMKRVHDATLALTEALKTARLRITMAPSN